ncbi:MAG: hypothetical protein B7Y15_01900 [Bacteroidetes bacterium 24-39-8]|nr:MAG: hypothetical protein B7Y15_01900 [Bacteroidetes bacterium 24-39-8]HQS54409.1 hypothetical protein [Sediminibacterium sp.]
MKKMLLTLTAFICMIGMSVAQTKTDAKAAGAKVEKAAPAAKSATPTKKDGTPDMRYKENKEGAKAAGPTKKDGTPDMRYKENKAPATPKKKG